MIIKGTTPNEEISEDDYDRWVVHQEGYALDLNHFFGGFDNNSNGLYEEIRNLKSLIELTGKMVLLEEQTAGKKRKRADDAEYDDVWYETQKSFSFRSYTYNSFLFLTHSLFEKRVYQLCQIIDAYYPAGDIPNKQRKYGKTEYRIQKYLAKRLPLDVIKTPEDYNYRIAFNKVRNAIYHNGLINSNSEPPELMEWLRSRNDIELKPHRKEGEFILTIKNSTLILEYIKVIENFFKQINLSIYQISS